jgi:hypothetical protein
LETLMRAVRILLERANSASMSVERPERRRDTLPNINGNPTGHVGFLGSKRIDAGLSLEASNVW